MLRRVCRHEQAAITSISRIEVLGFPGFASLSPNLAARLKERIDSMVILDLSEQVIARAITFRQEKKMRLADSIIAASALVHHLTLVTRNDADFKHIAGLDLRNPFATADLAQPGLI